MSFEVQVNRDALYPTIFLRDLNGKCEAEIYSFGGLLNAFKIPLKESVLNVVDAFTSVKESTQKIPPLFKSAKLSPFVGRLNQGQYQYRGKTYKIEKYYDGPNALHGILYDAAYEIVSVNADEKKAEVMLHHQYEGTDTGYPFPFNVHLRWMLQSGSKITVETTVKHENPFPIPYVDGWHPYFHLGTPIDECTLKVDSNQWLELNETLLPTGKKVRDEDCKHGISLRGRKLDHCYELDQSVKPKCILSNHMLQLAVEPDDSYPYLQIYTLANRHSIAIENVSAAPDAFNNKMGLKFIEPNNPYVFTTSYQFMVL